MNRKREIGIEIEIERNVKKRKIAPELVRENGSAIAAEGNEKEKMNAAEYGTEMKIDRVDAIDTEKTR